MARAAKRKVQVNSAATMAERRDSGLIRAMQFKEISAIMHDIGPGSDEEPMVYQIDVDTKYPHILSVYMWTFLEVMYMDFIHPNYFTPGKILQWKDIATDIYRANKSNDDIYKTFMRISRQMSVCSKKVGDLIHYEATEEELMYALYDVVLKVSMDNNIDLKGLLPNM